MEQWACGAAALTGSTSTSASACITHAFLRECIIGMDTIEGA
jgi:hypothetical protein